MIAGSIVNPQYRHSYLPLSGIHGIKLPHRLHFFLDILYKLCVISLFIHSEGYIYTRVTLYIMPNNDSNIKEEVFKEVAQVISDDKKELFVFLVSNLNNVNVKKFKITFDTEMLFR